jgi:hypothetical protein
MIILQDFCVSVTAIVAATNVFNARQSSIIALCLAIVYALCRACTKAWGVVPPKD